MQNGVTGLVSRSDREFVDDALRLLRDPGRRLVLGRAALEG
ncbi:MAG: hypothetical protein OXN89_04110 [Bryobacterales bacterium]|nr:hypothetical protein [Bryobacterales bacterium]